MSAIDLLLNSLDDNEIFTQVDIGNDGNLTNNPHKIPNQILKEYQSWDEVNNELYGALSSGRPPSGINVTATADGSIQAMYETRQIFDKFAKAIKEGSPCANCGKKVNFMPSNGYCSIKCAMTDMLKKIMAHKSKDKPYLPYLDAILETLDFLNLVMNVVIELPEKLKSIPQLPPEYANYVTIRINIAFLKIRIMINKLMIFKNQLIIKLLEPIKLGVIEDFVAGLFPPILQVVTIVHLLQIALDAAFQVALKAMDIPMLGLPPGCFAWIMTPRSMLRLPQYPLYVPILASPQPGVPLPPTMLTPMSAIDFQTILSIILKAFPPILAVEYFMEPELFDVRLALSDLGDIVADVSAILSKILKLGPEYMPRYTELSITNPWFVIATLIGWAPKAQASFGSIINLYP